MYFVGTFYIAYVRYSFKVFQYLFVQQKCHLNLVYSTYLPSIPHVTRSFYFEHHIITAYIPSLHHLINPQNAKKMVIIKERRECKEHTHPLKKQNNAYKNKDGKVKPPDKTPMSYEESGKTIKDGRTMSSCQPFVVGSFTTILNIWPQLFKNKNGASTHAQKRRAHVLIIPRQLCYLGTSVRYLWSDRAFSLIRPINRLCWIQHKEQNKEFGTLAEQELLQGLEPVSTSKSNADAINSNPRMTSCLSKHIIPHI